MEKNKEIIKRAYIRACNDYLYKLLDNWELYEGKDDVDFCWWVGDDVGGACCFDDDTFICMDDIRYCVDNDVEYNTYLDYIDYSCKCSEYGFGSMNLDAFVKGAPRVSNEQFEKLDGLKHDLYEAVDNVKKSMDKKMT